jgi:hypothetical protein
LFIALVVHLFGLLVKLDIEIKEKSKTAGSSSINLLLLACFQEQLQTNKKESAIGLELCQQH